MATAKSNPLSLICGDDDFAVKQRARQIYDQWSKELGGMDHEIVEATAANSGDALKALGKLREALQTLPFFGSGKVVWLRDCNFLGEERAASDTRDRAARISANGRKCVRAARVRCTRRRSSRP